MRARRLVAAVAGVTVGLIAGGGGAGASPSPSVQGAGWVTLPAAFGEVAGDRVLFQVRAGGDGTGSGRFTVVHLDDAGGLYARLVGDVTCVAGDGGAVVTTGVITHAWFRDFPGSAVVGMDAAITVVDGGRTDALGFDFEFFEGRPIAPCQAAPFLLPVDRGDFTVR